MQMTSLNKDNQHFVINDILLPIDPQNISIFKEGLDWGGSTLRDKTSAKVLSGNGVFNAQVSLIFTKAMYLHLHRLVCQIRNSPFVYIENKYITEQVEDGYGSGKLFAVASFQLVPMQNSPGTFVCELNLVYVNEKVFTSSLLYKEDLLVDYSSEEVSSFSIYEEVDEIIYKKTAKEKKQKQNAIRKGLKKIEDENIGFLKTKAVPRPIESNAYVKYGNFLQLKSLKKNFGISSRKIKALFNNDLLKLEGAEVVDNQRKCFGLHSSEINQESRIRLIELMIQGREDDLTFIFEEYKYLKLSKEESRKYREKLSLNLPRSMNKEEKVKRFSKKKQEVFEEIVKGEDSSLKRKIDALEREGYSPYLERPEYRNLFYKRSAITIKNGSATNLTNTDQQVSLTIKNTVVTNISAGFRPNLSIIPVSGSKFPTVQFLGGIEPIYQVDILSKSKDQTHRLAEGVKYFDSARDLLQKNSINFKIIPDSGYGSLDCLITRMLGTYEEEDYVLEVERPLKKRVIFKSMTNSTVEGAPGVARGSMVFAESKPYDTEKIKPIKTTRSSVEDRVVRKLSQTTFKKTKLIESGSGTSQGETVYHQDWYRDTNLSGIDEKYHEALDELKDITLNRLKKIQEALTKCFGPETSFIITSNGKLEKIERDSEKIERDKARKTASNHFVNSAVDIKIKSGSEITEYQLAHFIHALRITGNLEKDERLKNDSLFVQVYHNDSLDKCAFMHIDQRMKLSSRITKDSSGKIISVDYESILKKENGLFVNDSKPKNVLYLKNRKTGATQKNVAYNSELLTKYKELINEKIPSDSAGKIIYVEIEEDETVQEEEDNLIEEFDLKSALESYSTSKKVIGLSEETKLLKSLDKKLQTRIREVFGNQGTTPVENSDQIDIFENSDEVKSTLKEKGIRYIEDGEKIYIRKKEATYLSKLEQEDEARSIIEMLENFEGLASLMLSETVHYTDDSDEEIKRIRELLGEEEIIPLMTTYSLFLLNKVLENYSGTSKIKAALAAVEIGLGLAILTFATGGLALAGGGLLAAGGVGAVSSSVGLVDGTNLDRVKLLIKENIRDLEIYINRYSGFISKLGIPEEIKFDVYDINSGETFQNAVNELALKAFLDNPFLKQFKRLHTKSKSRALIASAIGFTEIEEGEDSENTTIAPIISYKEIQQFLTGLAAIPVEDEYGFDDSVLNEIFYLQFQKGDSIFNSSFSDSGNKENYYFPTLGKTWKEYEEDLEANKNKIPACIYQWETETKSIYLNTFFSKEEIRDNQEQKLAYLKNLKETLIKALISNPDIKETLGIVEENIFEEILDKEDTCYPDIDKPKDPRFKTKYLDPWFFYYDILEENGVGKKYLEAQRNKNVQSIIETSYDFEKAISQGLLTLRSTTSGEINLELKQVADSRSLDIIDTRVRDISEGSFEKQSAKIGEENIEDVATEKSVEATSPDGKDRDIPELNFNEVFGRKLFSKEDKEKLKKEVSEESKMFLQPFSKKDLIEGAKISNKNFLQDRRSYKKMFPTFKLYFVEEDAVESDELFIFDDFFSYNGVRSFSFYNNKKLAATTAQISLQNISGILDGTKPFVSRDVDLRQDVLADEELDLASNIQSIIVRPGLNVQLRAGYSENASDLKVLLSGRITEVQWSSGGDICDIIVQSYGVELVNKKFGIGSNDEFSSKTFYNTHTLLGNLALNESLKHFGRYKKGRVFQVGENKELALDLTNYKDDSWFVPVFTDGVKRWLYEHKVHLFIGAILFDAATSFIPIKFKGNVGNFISSAFSKASTTAAVKSASTTSATRIFLSNVLGGVKSLAGQNAILQALGSGIKGASKAIGNQFLVAAKAINTTINGFFTRSATSKVIAQIEKNILPGIKADIDGILKRDFGGKLLQELSELELKALYSSLREQVLPGQIPPGIWLAIKNFFSTSGRTLGNLNSRNLSGEALISELTNILGTRSLIKAGIHPAYSLKGGMTSFFQNAGYDLFFRLPRSMASGYMKFMSIGFILDTFISIGNSVKNWLYNAWKDKTNPRTLKLLLEPQDDNLYPPEPSMYLKRKSQTISGAIGDFFNEAWIAVLDSIRIATLNSTAGLEEALEGYDAFLDKRLSIKDGENEYNVRNSTIWDVFQEMTLRHPGWIAGARPYGQGMEYRLFFGVPSQRWWSKPLSNKMAEQLNKIQNAYLNLKRKSYSEIAKTLFPKADGKDLERLGREVVSYWSQKTSERYVPFRKYHYVRSGVNLISNKLRVESGIINEVAVAYESTKPEAVEMNDGTNSGKRYLIRNIRGSQHIPEELINSTNIGNYPNVKGATSAFRYGYSTLINSAKEMYSGEILVLGAPDIEPFDVCILNDNYSDMHGPVEVEAVTHMFSTSTGFVTEIKPNAIAFGNETMTSPSLVSTIVGMSQQKLLEKYPNLSRLGNKREIIEDIVEDQMDEYFSGTDSYIGKTLFRLFNDGEALNGVTRDKIVNEIQKNIREGNLRGLEAIIQGGSIKGLADRSVEGVLNLTAVAAGTATLIQATRSFIFSTEGVSTLNGASTSSFGLRAGGLSRNALGIALAAVAANVFFKDKISEGIDDSFRNGELGSRIFNNLILNKVSEGSVVRIIPVVKYGKPVLAGGYEKTNPKNSYKIVLGQYRNLLSDAMESYEEKKAEYEELAKLAGFKDLEVETTALGRMSRIGLGLKKVVVGGAFQQAWLRGGVSDIVSGVTGEMSPGAVNAFIQEKGAE